MADSLWDDFDKSKPRAHKPAADPLWADFDGPDFSNVVRHSDTVAESEPAWKKAARTMPIATDPNLQFDGAARSPAFNDVLGHVDTQDAASSDPSLFNSFKRGAASTLASTLHAVSDFVDQTAGAANPYRILANAGLLKSDDPATLAAITDPLHTQRIAQESLGAERAINAERAAESGRMPRRADALHALDPRDAMAFSDRVRALGGYGYRLANAGAESLPAMIGAVALRNPEIAAGVLGGTSGAQEYTDLRTQGVDRSAAAQAGVLNAAIEAGGEGLSLPFVMGRGGKGSLLRAMLAEGGQEAPTQIGQQYVEDLATGQQTPFLQQLGDAFDAFLVGSGLGAGGHVVSVGTDALGGAPLGSPVNPPEAAPASAIDPAILAGNAELGAAQDAAARKARTADAMQRAGMVPPEPTGDLDALLQALPPEVVAQAAHVLGSPSAPPAAALARPDTAPAAQTSPVPAEAPPTPSPAEPAGQSSFAQQAAAAMRMRAQQQAAQATRTAPAVAVPTGQPAPAPVGGDLPTAPDGRSPERPQRYAAADLRQEIGWSQRGGELVRAAPDPSTLNDEERLGIVPMPRGEVIGRTRWTGWPAPDGEESMFWRNRPDKGLSEAQANAAFDKFARGEPLKPIEQRFIDHAEATAKEYHEAMQLLDDAALGYSEVEHQQGVQALRDQLALDIDEADSSDAFAVYELARRAAERGVDDYEITRFSNESEPAYAARLWGLIKEADRGTDTRAAGEDRAAGDQGREGGAQRVPADFTLDQQPARTEARAEEVAPPETFALDSQAKPDAVADDEARRELQSKQTGLFGARELTDAADQQRAAQARSAPAASIGGGLFSGRVNGGTQPESADSISATEQLSRDLGEEDADRRGFRSAVEKVMGDQAGRVEYVNDVEGLPANLRRGVKQRGQRYSKDGGNVQTAAVYDPKSQRVFLVTSAIASPDRAVWNALHEIAGHDGLRKLLGPKLDRALELALQNPTVKALAKAIASERNINTRTQAGRMLAAEEALAELAAAVGTGDFEAIDSRYGVPVPEGVRATLQRAIDNFVRRLKAMLDDLFGSHVFTDEDVRALLDAARQASKGEGKTEAARGLESTERDLPDDPLVASHNISAEKLLHADKMGGLAVPSIGITHADSAFDGFGDITLIGHKSLIDPKQGAKAFGADVYSPRYPEVIYKLTPASVKRLNALIGADGARWQEYVKPDDLTREKVFKDHLEQKFGPDWRNSDSRAEAARVLQEAGATEHTFEGFTYSGNRRYKAHTLESVVKALKKEIRGGESFNYGVGSLRAHFTPQFRSVKQIRDNRSRLVSKEQFENIKKDIDDEFFGIVERLRDVAERSRGKEYGFSDTVIGVMEDAAKIGIPRALREYNIDGVSDDTQREMAEFLGKLRNLPTEYFEVKQLRAVGLDEFAGAVIPADTPKAARDVLDRHGIAYREYANADERKQVVKDFSHELQGGGRDILFNTEQTADHEAFAPHTDVDVADMPSRRPGESQAAYARRVANKGRDELQQIKAENAKVKAIGRANFKAMLARQARAGDIADKVFHEYRKVFDKAGKDAALASINQWETGQTVADPDARHFFDLMDTMFAERIAKVRSVAPDALQALVENYFPHIWEDSSKAQAWYAGNTKKPLDGNKSFLKQRTWGTIQEGMASGLRPVSYNPVDLALLKLQQMDKFIAFNEFKNDLQQRGWVQKIPDSGRIPPGYARVDSYAFGNNAIPEAIARDVNNYLSPSLYRYKAWKSLRYVQNVLMSTRLGFSMFHAGFTTTDNLIMHVDVAGRRLLDGDVAGGLSLLAKAPLTTIFSPYEGGVLNKAWTKQHEVDANTAALLTALEEGGAHRLQTAAQADFNNALPKLLRSIRQKSATSTLKSLLPAVGEASSWLIHQKLVPAQKMAARVMLIKFELDRLAGQLGKERGDYIGIIEAMHPDALRQVSGKVVTLVDDRLGQMNYDNQFWNKTAREATQALIGAVGWQVGTLRTVTGGIADLRRLWKPETLLAPLDKAGTITDADFGRISGRLSYLVSLALVMGGTAALTQFLLTGEPPDEPKDYFFPKTGRKNQDGSDERLQFPSYWMDHYKLATHPLQTAGHKIHPSIGLLMEAINNKDYWGAQVRDEDASWLEQAKQVGEYVAKGFIPYSITGQKKLADNDAGPVQKVANFFGVTTAPASVSRTSLAAFVAERSAAKAPQGGMTRHQAERSRHMHEVEDALRRGESPDMSDMSQRDQKAARKASQLSVLQIRFKRLSLIDKLRAWDRATPDERKRYELRDMLPTGRRLDDQVANLPEEDRESVRQQVIDIRTGPPEGYSRD